MDIDDSTHTQLKQTIESITEAEWIIVEILWEKSQQSANDIIKALSDKTDWNPKTIRTLIKRLVDKRVIETDTSIRPYQFTSLVSKQDCLHEKSKDFVNRIYHGSLSLMVSNFIKNEKLSPDEIKKLRNILDKIEG